MNSRSGMSRSVLAAALGGCAAFVAQTGVSQQPHWQAYADCAAGYRANWQDRRSDPSRSKQMADMILMQAEDYEAAAGRRYVLEERAGEEDAKRAVHSYVEAQLDRFIAMDKADKLNDFLDRCPQPDDSGSL